MNPEDNETDQRKLRDQTCYFQYFRNNANGLKYSGDCGKKKNEIQYE